MTVMNKINKEIGLRIAESRKKYGMTAVELAEKTGFSSARISHWEHGRRLPNFESILKLEEILNIPAAWLLGVDNNISKEKNIPLYKITEVTQSDPLCSLSVSLLPDSETGLMFAVKLMDDSMNPLFRKQDIVLFNRHKEPVDGSSILLLIKKTGQILFRNYRIDNHDMNNPAHKFIASNPEIENISTTDPESFAILGVYNDSFRLFL